MPKKDGWISICCVRRAASPYVKQAQTVGNTGQCKEDFAGRHHTTRCCRMRLIWQVLKPMPLWALQLILNYRGRSLRLVGIAGASAKLRRTAACVGLDT
ncbi:MAG: hypothetical protein WBK91_07820 [Alphaproteobacteria bacterium]